MAWVSQPQKCTAKSSTEAEYLAYLKQGARLSGYSVFFVTWASRIC
jgi:hypothetical protein